MKMQVLKSDMCCATQRIVADFQKWYNENHDDNYNEDKPKALTDSWVVLNIPETFDKADRLLYQWHFYVTEADAEAAYNANEVDFWMFDDEWVGSILVKTMCLTDSFYWEGACNNYVSARGKENKEVVDALEMLMQPSFKRLRKEE